MRRKISLYIADQLVDLDEQSFVLMNYTMDDLSNPVIVKNTFSQQIVLKGTPGNNRVFGDSFRADRQVQYNGGSSGVGFDASKKTPFVIYNELGEILESGYVKLDSVERNGADIQYKITLYGGLGSFLYSLSYDESGNKRTLADLDYLGNGDPTELDFTIDKANLEQAWEDLYDLYYGASPTPTGKWTIVNFAPAYNGFPDNFSPDKGLLSLPGAGLPASVNGYSPKSGYGLVNLANPQDEWAVKDIRTYLQRPVLSVKAFLAAICNPANNGGHSVEISDLSPYDDLWLTLPTIPSLGSIKQTGQGLSVTMSSSASTGNEIGRFDVNGSIPFGAVVNADLKCRLRYNMPSGANSYNTLSLGEYDNSGSLRFSVVFLQMVAYASDGTIVGGSAVKVLSPVSRRSPRALANGCNFVPAFATDQFEAVDYGSIGKVSSGVFEVGSELTFQVECQNASYYKLMASAYTGTGTLARGEWTYSYSGDGSSSRATLYATYSTYFQASSCLIAAGSGSSVTKTDSSELRSGARVTKGMLLSTSATPADYLLSLCKTIGLYFVIDDATGAVSIVKRNDLYLDETIDLTERVDLSKGITIRPLVFDNKWYDFIPDGVGGAFWDEYQTIEGIPYGIQRVDTGYDFNADSVNLMESSVFKAAATILARSRYWNIINMASSTEVETPVDLSVLQKQGLYINSNNVWKSSATFKSVMIPVTPGEKYRFHLGSINGTIAVLKNGNQTIDTAAQYTTTYPSKITPTEGMEITIPSDGNYIYMVTTSSSGEVDTEIDIVTLLNSVFVPSPFLDSGNTITRWNSDGETLDTQISCPPSTATITYYNTDYPGYDAQGMVKVQFADASGKMVDGKDVLLFLNGFHTYDKFKITDDLPVMAVVNDGKPCWILDEGEGLDLPIFSTYGYEFVFLDRVMTNSMDYGVPRQLDIPGIAYDPATTIYARAWKAYISDRYDADTKVMTCRVDFSGIRVSRDLLRKFYWYDNALWVLNAIRNYSLTTYDPVECEFVQVQYKSNYLNGQTY